MPRRHHCTHMLSVDLHKSSGSEVYYPYSALDDLGATYNSISQSVADKLGLEAVKGWKEEN